MSKAYAQTSPDFLTSTPSVSADEIRMLLAAGLRLVGAYAAASEESPAKLAATVRQLGELLPPHMVR